MTFLKIVAFLLLIAGLVFIFQNLDEVTVHFLQLSFTGPVALTISATLIGGFLIGLCMMMPARWRLSQEISKLKKEIVLLKKADPSTIIYRSEGLGEEGQNNI